MQLINASMIEKGDVVIAISESTVGNTNVAYRLAESTIMEILYAGVVTLIPEQAKKYLVKSAENLLVNKEA